MKRVCALLWTAATFAAMLAAQPFKFDLSHLDAKASSALDLSLNHSTLQFAAKFLDGSDPEEAQVKKLLEGIDSITIKTGDASISLKNNGDIKIKGNNITIEGSGKIQVKASGDVSIKGSKVTSN